jgi:alpha-methylacyl-CoA racemase
VGPLHGYKIVEVGSIGPGPFCAMMLADMGAEVVRLDRLEAPDLGIEREARYATLNRGRRSVGIDLKSPHARAAVLRMLTRADALIEGFRPGVMERLGLGPDACLAVNPKLVYGRMTGWGQDGPLLNEVGHDINYLAITGALHSIGRKDQPPSPPLNLVGDLGGGGMYLAFGIVCSLLEARGSGRGQVVDAAMVDGVTSLLSGFYGLRAAGKWDDRRGENFVDSGAPWYDSYETSDGKYISIGSIEGRFYRNLLERLGLSGHSLPAQHDRRGWPVLRNRFSEVFKQKSRDEWVAIMSGHEVCFAPVLDLVEATEHPHMKSRKAHVVIDGLLQPAPAPRFSRTVPNIPIPPREPGSDTEAALADWGFSDPDIADLRANDVIR